MRSFITKWPNSSPDVHGIILGRSDSICRYVVLEPRDLLLTSSADHILAEPSARLGLPCRLVVTTIRLILPDPVIAVVRVRAGNRRILTASDLTSQCPDGACSASPLVTIFDLAKLFSFWSINSIKANSLTVYIDGIAIDDFAIPVILPVPLVLICSCLYFYRATV